MLTHGNALLLFGFSSGLTPLKKNTFSCQRLEGVLFFILPRGHCFSVSFPYRTAAKDVFVFFFVLSELKSRTKHQNAHRLVLKLNISGVTRCGSEKCILLTSKVG